MTVDNTQFKIYNMNGDAFNFIDDILNKQKNKTVCIYRFLYTDIKDIIFKCNIIIKIDIQYNYFITEESYHTNNFSNKNIIIFYSFDNIIFTRIRYKKLYKLFDSVVYKHITYISVEPSLSNQLLSNDIYIYENMIREYFPLRINFTVSDHITEIYLELDSFDFLQYVYKRYYIFIKYMHYNNSISEIYEIDINNIKKDIDKILTKYNIDIITSTLII